MERKNKKSGVSAITCLVILMLVGAAAFLLMKKPEKKPSEPAEIPSQSELGTITYEGQKYNYNVNLMNILFLGIDNYDEIRDDNIPGESGQSDCILIISMDKTTKTVKILQIPRDTMTEIDIYDANGNYYTSVQEQIATQYAYSIGGESSCWATKKTVSELLYDLQIDGYIALDMAAISIINDAAGGVTITIPEDYTGIDSAFQQNATITLDGKQAEKYVRYRDTNEDFSNNERMQRQTQYIPALLSAVKTKVTGHEDFYSKFLPLVEKYMVTDLTESQIEDFMHYELADSEMIRIPGEGKKGEVFEEYYVDEKELKKILIETFYISEK